MRDRKPEICRAQKKGSHKRPGGKGRGGERTALSHARTGLDLEVSWQILLMNAYFLKIDNKGGPKAGSPDTGEATTTMRLAAADCLKGVHC